MERLRRRLRARREGQEPSCVRFDPRHVHRGLLPLPDGGPRARAHDRAWRLRRGTQGNRLRGAQVQGVRPVLRRCRLHPRRQRVRDQRDWPRTRASAFLRDVRPARGQGLPRARRGVAQHRLREVRPGRPPGGADGVPRRRRAPARRAGRAAAGGGSARGAGRPRPHCGGGRRRGAGRGVSGAGDCPRGHCRGGRGRRSDDGRDCGHVLVARRQYV